MLVAARSFVPAADFRQAAAEAIPFSDGSFDLAFMGLVLHETDDLHKAIQEACRVSKIRLAVLELPYIQQNFGPSQAERLEAEQIVSLAKQAGFPAEKSFHWNT